MKRGEQALPSSPNANMRSLAIFLVLLALCHEALGAIGGENTQNLDPDAQLRVGVKFRPPTCETRSKAGDRLSMHYTGEAYTLATGAPL